MVTTNHSISDMVTQARNEKERVKIEVSLDPIVGKRHCQRLPLHNYFRTKQGLAHIGVDEFAEQYPGSRDRRWHRVFG
jgi:hypothetical protein